MQLCFVTHPNAELLEPCESSATPNRRPRDPSPPALPSALTFLHNLTSIDLSDIITPLSILAPLLAPRQPLRTRLKHLRLDPADFDDLLQDWIFQLVLFLAYESVGTWPPSLRWESIARVQALSDRELNDDELKQLEWEKEDYDYAEPSEALFGDWTFFVEADLVCEEWESRASRQERRYPPEIPLQVYHPFSSLVFLSLPFASYTHLHIAAIFLGGMAPRLRTLLVNDQVPRTFQHPTPVPTPRLARALRRSISRSASFLETLPQTNR